MNKRAVLTAISLASFLLFPSLFLDSQIVARVISIAGICLVLWISEAVPPFVPTILLWALVPLLLGPLDPRYQVGNVLLWAADPVMALFFGGLALGVATQTTGFDRRLTNLALTSAGGSYKKLLFLVLFITAFLSMWISNIAAAAMIFSSLRPVLGTLEENEPARRKLLIAVAFGADLGGMATPVGTGPNAIAIASVGPLHPISFVSWMVFAFPLTVGMLLISFALLTLAERKPKPSTVWEFDHADADLDAAGTTRFDPKQVTFLVILVSTVTLWLAEPLHQVASSVIALCSAAALFATRVLTKDDLPRIGWSTLLLIAGGITLGRLLEATAIMRDAAGTIPFADLDPRLGLFVICLASAMLSALMSNTATVILLIPLAAAIDPAPSTTILVAISASFGIPFIISTPPNSMAFSQGGVRFGDLFWPGILMMVFGCALVSLTGKTVLNLAGIP